MQKKFKPLVKYSFMLTAGVALLAGCRGGDTTTLEYLPNMMDTIVVKAQEEPMRTPPEGTIPQGFSPYRFKADQGELAGKRLSNPLPVTHKVMRRGQEVYNTYCIVCHGAAGLGDGSVVPAYPRPPSLTSDKIVNWKDGQLYHTITMGQNLMPSYSSQIPQEDRWAAVHFIRALQRAQRPTKKDLRLLKEQLESLK